MSMTPQEGSLLPQLQARVTKDMWDMSTTGLGMAFGGAVGHIPGLVIGGAVGYGVGYVRWQYLHRSKP